MKTKVCWCGREFTSNRYGQDMCSLRCCGESNARFGPNERKEILAFYQSGMQKKQLKAMYKVGRHAIDRAISRAIEEAEIAERKKRTQT